MDPDPDLDPESLVRGTDLPQHCLKVRGTKTILCVRVQGGVVRDVAGQPGARLSTLPPRLNPSLHQVRE